MTNEVDEWWISDCVIQGRRGLQDVRFQEGVIQEIQETSRAPAFVWWETPQVYPEKRLIHACGAFLLPGLAQPHIHLDKCHLLGQCELRDGSFQEAMEQTSIAKREFTKEDVYSRGSRLLRKLACYGVMTVLTHVEVDPVVNFTCLDACLDLQAEFKRHLSLEIAIFAQDSIFGNTDGSAMVELLDGACAKAEGKVRFIGSAPYVDSDPFKNIDAIFALSDKHNLDIQFHLDYDLDSSRRPLVWHVLEKANSSPFLANSTRKRKIVLAHMTKLALMSDKELDELARLCENIDVHFIGLPTSDLYMMGRDIGLKPRGTLDIFKLHKRGLNVSLSSNNVDNAFTPQGSGDPMELLPLSIAVQQKATHDDMVTMLQCVSINAESSIYATPAKKNLGFEVGDKANMVLIPVDKEDLEADKQEERVISSVCCRPHPSRVTIYQGNLVAQTECMRGLF